MTPTREIEAPPRYKDFTAIGAGGMGLVFRAHDTRLDRTVAIKRIHTTDEEALVQLRQEAGVLATLNHPNILTILDVGHDEQGHYLVMEMLEGEDLSTLIARSPLSYEDFRELALQSLEGLAAAHERKILHLDLKPENIRVKRMPGGRLSVKLIDFGLARIVHAPRKQTTSQEGMITGTIYFMAPEQLRRQPMDQRMDLYALGSVFYLALCGVRPFDAPNMSDLIQMICTHQVMPLHMRVPHLAPWLCGWVHQMMAFDPALRHPDAGSAIQNFRWLERSISSMSVPAVPFLTTAPTALEDRSAPSPQVKGESAPVASPPVPRDAKATISAEPSATTPARRWRPWFGWALGGAGALIALAVMLPPLHNEPATAVVASPAPAQAAQLIHIPTVKVAALGNEEQLLARFVATSGTELGLDKNGKGPTNRVRSWTALPLNGVEPIRFLPSLETTANLPAIQTTRARGAFTWLNFKPTLPNDPHSKCLIAQVPWENTSSRTRAGYAITLVLIPGACEQPTPILTVEGTPGQIRLSAARGGVLRLQVGKGTGRQETEVQGLDTTRPCIATLSYTAATGALSFRVRTATAERHTPPDMQLAPKPLRRLYFTLGNTAPPSSGQIAEIALFASGLDAIQCAVNENRLQEFYFGIKEK